MPIIIKKTPVDRGLMYALWDQEKMTRQAVESSESVATECEYLKEEIELLRSDLSDLKDAVIALTTALREQTTVFEEQKENR